MNNDINILVFVEIVICMNSLIKLYVSIYKFNQNTFAKKYHNNSLFQLNRKSISSIRHMVWNLCLEFYKCDLLSV